MLLRVLPKRSEAWCDLKEKAWINELLKVVCWGRKVKNTNLKLSGSWQLISNLRNFVVMGPEAITNEVHIPLLPTRHTNQFMPLQS
jgi:hypothetical protein